jgi:hypothetical protein
MVEQDSSSHFPVHWELGKSEGTECFLLFPGEQDKHWS